MAANSNMHNLTTLIKRLEAATSRLEDMASFVEPPATNGSSSETPANVDAVVPVPAHAAQGQQEEPLPDSITAFDEFLSTTVKKYVELSDEIGGIVAEQAALVLSAFTNQRKFLHITTKSKKPEMGSPDYMELVKPLQGGMEAVNDIRDTNRASPMFNELSTVSEGISVLGWVTIEAKPYQHVDDSLASAQYYGNRVLKEHKESGTKQVAWVAAYYAIFQHLSKYVKETFPNGVVWNAQGISPLDALKAVEEAPAVTTPHPAAGPPGPPPPPPGPAPKIELKNAAVAGAAAGAAAGGIGAVFSELNKGADVTKGLKKVNPDEMTHKNPSLRAGAIVPTRSDSQSSASSGKAPGKKPKPENLRTKKPPKKELEGNKWIIENYDNESQPVEIEATMAHSILISRCNKTTIMVKGKANAISVDNSTRLSLVIESLVSSVDVIKSSNFALQVLGTLPTILLDQVDGAQIYLGKESMSTEVFSSKSSGINLNIIAGTDEDYKEIALPEQIKSTIGKDGKISSEIVEHAG